MISRLSMRAVAGLVGNFVAFAFFLFLLSGCMEAPTAHNSMSLGGIPDHTMFGNTSCLECHAADRPEPVIDAATGASIIHGGGADCMQCHTAGTVWAASALHYSHSPTPLTCVECHISKRPTQLVNKMLHSFPNVGDCVGCHAADAGDTWAKGKFNHQPLPASCVECHAAERPKTIVQGFSHEAGGMGDCVSCHKSPGVRWSDGFFSHTPTPTSCSTCHASERPTGLVGTPAFNHAIAGMGDCKSCHIVQSATQTNWSGGSFTHSPTPTSCKECHLGIRPVGLSGNPPFDHARAGTGDCSSCHAVKSATKTDWTGGTFTHNPVPTSCKDCHVADRPKVPVGSPLFDHSISGMGECNSCHAVKSATKVDWTGGQYSHTPTPTSCNQCHLANRPVAVTASGFNHSINGTGDCISCHQYPGVRWTGAMAGFNHSPAPATCANCHSAKRPALAVNVAWPGHPNNPNQFLHTVAGTGDCKGCHQPQSSTKTDWTGGVYTHAPASTQCMSCHVNQRPVGLAGNPPFNHANGGMGDCVSCHANKTATKLDWTGGFFNHLPVPATCIECHLSDRPTGLAGNPVFDHAIAGTGDCKSCHAVRTPTKTDWTGGFFNHTPKPATCAGCHLAKKPTAPVRIAAVSTDGKTYQNDYVHSFITGDCVSCHIVRSATKTDWTGGKYSHSPSPASCATCHNITKPTTGVSFDHNQAGLGDCKGCHAFAGQKWTGASSVPASVTLVPPSGKSAWGNITAPHPVIDSAKVGLACTTCHGTNTAAKIIRYDHAKPVSGVKCLYCHYTGQLETSFAVVTKGHEGAGGNNGATDCVPCHNQVQLPAWSATTKTFSGGKWNRGQ